MWLSMAVASQALKIPDYATNRKSYIKIDWRPDGWEWVNPSEDVNTAKALVRNGFASREQIVTETGGDIDEVDRQNEERNKITDEAGLVYDSDPRKASDSGTTQARPAGSLNPSPDKFDDGSQPEKGSNSGFQSVDDQRNQDAVPQQEAA
jgi:capsid protein